MSRAYSRHTTMLLPRVTRGDDVVYKAFCNPGIALRELQMTRILSAALIEGFDDYSQDLRHIVVFERATPLPELKPSLCTGLDVLSGLLRCLEFLHDVFGVTHNAVSPDHVVIDQDDECKLIDSKHITTLGAPQHLQCGMRAGFVCADAIVGGRRVEERHAVYSVAVTSLWAIRRVHSFVNLQDPLYKTGKSLLEAGNLEQMRRTWSLRDEELLLLPHLVGGFQQESLDCLGQTTGVASLPTSPARAVSKGSTRVAIDNPKNLKRKDPGPPLEAPAVRRKRRTRP